MDINIPSASESARMSASNTVRLIEEYTKSAVRGIAEAATRGEYTASVYMDVSVDVAHGVARRLREHGYDASVSYTSGSRSLEIRWEPK